MKLISWNVNGIRACIKKGFMEFFNEIDADIFCVQESKCQVGQVEIDTPTYHQYWNQATKKGYSGTIIFSKIEPISVKYDMGHTEHDDEGRLITLEYENFYLINSYTPNSKRELLRLDYRVTWEEALREYINSLNKIKPVILCGDLNVAHNEIDLKNPKSNKKNAGFTIQERDQMTFLLADGYIDSFRYLYPERIGAYSWWSYMRKARDNNTGWRLDYFIVSKGLKENIVEAKILSDILGSDHCPVELDIII